MNWIKRHKFWVTIIAITIVLGLVDTLLETSAVRVAWWFIGIAIIVKLIYWQSTRGRHKKGDTDKPVGGEDRR